MAFRDYITHNFWWKLLSLLLAALTWLTIQTLFKNEEKLRATPVVPGESSRVFPAVPVQLLAPAASADRFVVTPATVAVKVVGKQEDLQRLQSQDVRAYVDVTGTDDETKFRRTIQVQAPKDFNAAADPPVANLERINNSK